MVSRIIPYPQLLRGYNVWYNKVSSNIYLITFVVLFKPHILLGLEQNYKQNSCLHLGTDQDRTLPKVTGIKSDTSIVKR